MEIEQKSQCQYDSVKKTLSRWPQTKACRPWEGCGKELSLRSLEEKQHDGQLHFNQ